MEKKLQLGTITILVKDRQSHAADVNRILTERGHMIAARLGVNVQRTCIEHCTGLITVVVEATTDEINLLTAELDNLYGIVAKATIITE